MAGPSGSTPVLHLPYPISDDTADVPRDIKALADRLEALSAATVESLPALADVQNGAQVLWRPSQLLMQAAQPVAWTMLACKGVSGVSDGWYYLGGEDAFSPQFPRWDHALTAHNAPAAWAGGSQMTAPAHGTWQVEFGPWAARLTSAPAGFLTYRPAIVVAADNTRLVSHELGLPGVGYAGSVPLLRAYNTLTAGDTLEVRAFSGSGSLPQTVINNIVGIESGARLRMRPYRIF